MIRFDVTYSLTLSCQDAITLQPLRPTSSKGSLEKSARKQAAGKSLGKDKDILEVAGEFKEMVTQMAFEKFDFHQWFRYVITIMVLEKKTLDLGVTSILHIGF